MKRLILIFCAISTQVFAALSANTVWQTRTDGNDANGGGFVTGASGTDFTDQAAAQFTFTTATTAGADAIFLDAQAAASMVGNILNITGGTNFIVGSYQVMSVSVGVSMTLDRNCTTGAGALGTGSLGGSKLTLAAADDAMIGGNICFVKAGTYTLTTTWPVTLTTAIATRFIGFDTTRTVNNTDATRPLVTTATNSVVLITTNAANNVIFKNFTFTTTAGTKVAAYANATTGSGDTAPITFINCKWSTAFTSVLVIGSSATSVGASFIGCEITGTSGFAFDQSSNQSRPLFLYGCWIHDNTLGGITATAGTTNRIIVDRSIIADNGGRGIHITGTTTQSVISLWVNNSTIANNTTSQIETELTTGNNGNIVLTNNIIYASSSWIHNATAGIDASFVTYNNAFGGGGSNNNFTTGNGSISLSGDPFTNAAGDNYALNNTAGAGASCRGVGFPTTFPGGFTASTIDLGAAQHADSGSGGQRSYSF